MIAVPYRIERYRGHTVLAYPAASKPVVADCGAHKGEFSAAVNRAWGAVCHAAEPTPGLFRGLAIAPPGKAYNFAIFGTDGHVSFKLSDNPEASSIVEEGDNGSVQVQARSLSGFLGDIGHVDLLKMDIEGAEIAAFDNLSDADLQRIGQITVEFHDFCGAASVSDVKRIIQRLKRCGFYAFKFSFFTRGDMLFVNSRLAPMSIADRVRIGMVHFADKVSSKVRGRGGEH